MFHFVMIVCCPLKACFFSNERQADCGSQRGACEELRRIEGEEMLIRIYYRKKEYMFNKRKQVTKPDYVNLKFEFTY